MYYSTSTPNVWRLLGFVSSLLGFICYAMTRPFNKLYDCGELGLLGIIIYCVLASLVCCAVLFATPWRLTKKSLLKVHFVFSVLMGGSVYSFYMDKIKEGKEVSKVLNIISTGSFALTSLSLSRVTDVGFEVGMFNLFLGFVMTSVMKMNGKFALAAAAFCYILISIRTYSEGTRGSSDAEQALTENVPSHVSLVRNLDGRQDLNNYPISRSFTNIRAIQDSARNPGLHNDLRSWWSFGNVGRFQGFARAENIDIRRRPVDGAFQSEGTQSHSEGA